MELFSAKIDVPAGTTLAGQASRKDLPTTSSGTLEAHGLGLTSGASASWEICSVDALYPGELAADVDGERRVYAASHTHSAPMLDRTKPSLGAYSVSAVQSFRAAIDGADRKEVSPDRCSIYAGVVDIPIYRRYDFPPTRARRLLNGYLGFHPNPDQPLDKNVYIFLFEERRDPSFAIVYHACHPVSRRDNAAASADFIAAIRAAVAQRFGVTCCLFFQGCSGDVRPNCTRPLIGGIPATGINRRFLVPAAIEDEESIDLAYRNCVLQSKLNSTIEIDGSCFAVTRRALDVMGLGRVPYETLRIGTNLTFSFMPFEVSHRFHLDQVERPIEERTYIVSCCNRVIGYLPYIDQLDAGGYEVDGSREFMNLKNRISVGRGALG